MKLCFSGHDYKYAVEQIMLMMFPDERPVYGEKPSAGEAWADVRISAGKTYTTASSVVSYGGKTVRAFSRVRNDELTDPLVTERLRQRVIKLSFYKASVTIRGNHPVWGALTGIRPAKLATSFLEDGQTPAQAVKSMQREFFVTPKRAELCVDAALASIQADKAVRERDIALYVGIPFCPTRCAYCSFVSNSVEKSMKLIPPYLDALDREIEVTGRLAEELGLRVTSVYFGGGTPTTLSAEELERVIGKVRQSFDLSQNREFTVEAGRPDTITPEKMAALRTMGVDRVSINPQSMSDTVLKAIGRRHSAADIYTAYEMARNAGIPVINMDLIAGLPADSPEGFRKSLDEVLALNPENVTVHTLALKKGSRITLEGTEIPDGEAVGEMLDYASLRLTGSGYAPYYLYRQKFISGGFENVGWAKPGTENLYNICIMEELCTILAMGGGGSTKLVHRPTGHITRIFDPKYPLEYTEKLDKVLSDKEKIRAFYESDGSFC